MSDEAIRLLKEIRDGQREILAELRALGERRPAGVLAHEDREKIGTLLPAIHAAVGQFTFSVASLLEHASARDVALLEALSVSGSTRSLGKLLLRCVDQEVEGLRLRHIGRKAGHQYMLEKVEETTIAQINRRSVAHR